MATERDIFLSSLKESASLKKQIYDSVNFSSLVKFGDDIVASIRNGGKLLLCGNGGSAADAQHLAAELLVRLRPNFNRQAIPAMSLSLDTSTLTACGNDFGYEYIFERALRGLGKSGDVLLVISTSGNSKNINLALKASLELGIKSFGLLGSSGGEALHLCNDYFLVPSDNTARIQEVHITLGHALMEYVEDSFLEEKYIKLS